VSPAPLGTWSAPLLARRTPESTRIRGPDQGFEVPNTRRYVEEVSAAWSVPIRIAQPDDR
jgi:hypothetical protein